MLLTHLKHLLVKTIEDQRHEDSNDFYDMLQLRAPSASNAPSPCMASDRSRLYPTVIMLSTLPGETQRGKLTSVTASPMCRSYVSVPMSTTNRNFTSPRSTRS